MAPTKKIQVNEIGLGFGFHFLSIFCVAFGQLFNFPPVKVRRFSTVYFIFKAYSYIFCLFLTLISFGGLKVILKTYFDFSTTAYYMTGFLGVSKTTTRCYFLIMKQKKIDTLMLSFKNLLNQPTFVCHQKKIVRKISMWVIVSFIILMTIYTSGLIISYTALRETLLENQNATFKHFFKDAFLEGVTVLSNLMPFEMNVPTYCISHFMFVVYVIAFLSVGKLITSDILFYSSYLLIIEEIEVLVQTLGPIIVRKRYSHQDLSAWLNFHHNLSELLSLTNDITLFPVIVSVVFTAVQACLFGVVATKQHLGSSHTFAIALFALTSIQQLFIFCMLGQKIRGKIVNLQSAVYFSPWLGSRRVTQHATLMICSAATERAMPLPGAPFVALSMEFFASVLGAIFTYFVVLIQVNN